MITEFLLDNPSLLTILTLGSILGLSLWWLRMLPRWRRRMITTSAWPIYAVVAGFFFVSTVVSVVGGLILLIDFLVALLLQ